MEVAWNKSGCAYWCRAAAACNIPRVRPKLVSGSCIIAVILLVIAQQGFWASATAEDGTRYKIGLRKVTHMVQAPGNNATHSDCDYLRGQGAVELCAPAPEADAAFSMLCASFPLMAAAGFFAFMSAFVTINSPYGAKGTAAALAGAAFAAAFAATVFAKISMPFAFAILVGPKTEFGGLAFSSAWTAVACLLFAAGLSTTSTMLRHT